MRIDSCPQATQAMRAFGGAESANQLRSDIVALSLDGPYPLAYTRHQAFHDAFA